MGFSSTAAMGMQAFGVGMSTMGSYSQAKAQKVALKYEAAIARNNEKLANYQADVELENGVALENQARLKTAALKGDQRADMAAAGVDLGTGSASEVLATTDMMGELDALTIRDSAARKAWALREQGKGYAAEAGFDDATAGAINPFTSAASTFLTGAGKVADSWYRYSKTTK